MVRTISDDLVPTRREQAITVIFKAVTRGAPLGAKPSAVLEDIRDRCRLQIEAELLDEDTLLDIANDVRAGSELPEVLLELREEYRQLVKAERSATLALSKPKS